jgi:excisionase family DNA binding protein
MVIHDLSTHSAHYVTIAELSDYWAVSRQQIHKWIESEKLGAIRFGSRLYRVPRQAALDFERRASVSPVALRDGERSVSPRAKSASVNNRLPDKFGVRRAGKVFG